MVQDLFDKECNVQESEYTDPIQFVTEDAKEEEQPLLLVTANEHEARLFSVE